MPGFDAGQSSRVPPQSHVLRLPLLPPGRPAPALPGKDSGVKLVHNGLYTQKCGVPGSSAIRHTGSDYPTTAVTPRANEHHAAALSFHPKSHPAPGKHTAFQYQRPPNTPETSNEQTHKSPPPVPPAAPSAPSPVQ